MMDVSDEADDWMCDDLGEEEEAAAKLDRSPNPSKSSRKPNSKVIKTNLKKKCYASKCEAMRILWKTPGLCCAWRGKKRRKNSRGVITRV